MEKAVKAIWYHYVSTKENPQHDFCSTGPTSWCKWHKDQVNNTNTFERKKVDAVIIADSTESTERVLPKPKRGSESCRMGHLSKGNFHWTRDC